MKNDLKESIKKQLRDFRWRLAGYYRRPIMAICSNQTFERIIEEKPSTKEDFLEIDQFNRKNFVLWNHIEEIKEIISPL